MQEQEILRLEHYCHLLHLNKWDKMTLQIIFPHINLIQKVSVHKKIIFLL